MENIKIVTKDNSINFISLMKNEEYLDWKANIIKEEITRCPANILTEYIPFFSEWEINKIKSLNENLPSKILYDCLLRSNKEEEFLEEIAEPWQSILELRNIMDDGVILQMLIMEYDCFQIN